MNATLKEAIGLQMLVAGGLLGSTQTMQTNYLEIEIEPQIDEEGNYQPYFFITGKNTGVRLRVSVELEGVYADVSPPESAS